ncbi:hypothetical protein QBC34DRAFT_173588 [Podospora aff. communis PSN243]|uniref:DUF4149 domain-containing protein n=1 Tax=Podospora aff. communis PSN243 TaxID=3040156 RepID=A0AAV9H1M5_9PEZI|nr:hypothetical protein QBC34DRAFT_173588 [Podospora aff. communis PSN243]
MPIPFLNKPWIRAPFLLHWSIEVPAAASFLLTPSLQLHNPSPETKLVLRSYGSLLLASCALSIMFLSRPRYDDASIIFGFMMAFYHIFPIYRAMARMQAGRRRMREARTNKVLGGPGLHFIVHLSCFLSLLGGAMVTFMYPQYRR